MTPKEYALRMDVYALRKADRLYEYAQLALFNRMARARSTDGKRYIVTKPEQIYSVENVERKVASMQAERFAELFRIAYRLIEYRKAKGIH